MDILLLTDVHGIGQRNEIVSVRDGYALNFLLPQRKGLVATPTVRKRYALEIKRRADERALEEEFRRSVTSALGGKTLAFTRKVTKTGKLYGAISAKDIVAALKEQLTLDVPETAVEIGEPIKATGKHTVTVKMGATAASLAIEVKPDVAKVA